MEEGEFDVRVPIIDENGNVEYFTVMVKVDPNWTMEQALAAIEGQAIGAFENFQGTSDRVNGFELLPNNVGGLDFEIAGFVSSTGYFAF